MFHRKKDSIELANNNNKIKPSNTTNTTPPPGKAPSTDILLNALNSQQITNAEYMTLNLQLEILKTLNEINVSCKSIAVSNEFLGRYVSNKFKWF